MGPPSQPEEADRHEFGTPATQKLRKEKISIIIFVDIAYFH